MANQGWTLETELTSLRELVNARLQTYVESSAGSNRSDCPANLWESMAYSLLAGGKRLRPIMTLLACEACGGTIAAAMPAACAIEMIHTYSLIHDDLPAMDDDDYRRGRLTNHKVYGEAMAILAGDALLTLAFEVMANDITPGSVAASCCADLASAAGWCGMVAGQVADIEAESDQNRDQRQILATSTPDHDDSPVSRLEAIHRRKTGRLLTSAVTLGARVAQAPPEIVQRLEEFGKCVGLAFQIADDLLDVTGDAAKLGKGVGKDAALGKMTYPSILGIDESRSRADRLIDKAMELLKPLGEQGRKLGQMATFVTNRDH